jgi:integrase
MAGKLTDRVIRQTTTPGVYPDGDGLYLQVTAGKDGKPRRSWFVRLRLPTGKSRDMGLGRLELVPLRTARERATTARQEAKAGRDPVAEKEAARTAAAVEEARATTFRQCAEGYIAAHASGWRNEKHAAQWGSTLAQYVYPVFGDLPVAVIDTPLVMKALDPIWATKTETASRVRGRIEAVLDWARVRGHRTGDNPARWTGNLAYALPSRAKAKPRGRHAALPFDAMPAFWRDLAAREGVGAEALRFAILTAARTGEAIGARWEEIDMDRATWTVPAARMKGGREHRVPLSRAALEILHEMGGPKNTGAVFPGARPDKPLSNMALLMTLRRMNRADLTAHGFRSTFRDWAAETTNFPREAAEAALAHTIGDKVEAAYRRGDLFEKRRRLMDAWGSYCTTPATERGAARTFQRAAETA